MAKTLPSSNGYFNKEMLAILRKGEENSKSTGSKKSVKRTGKKK